MRTQTSPRPGEAAGQTGPSVTVNKSDSSVTQTGGGAAVAAAAVVAAAAAPGEENPTTIGADRQPFVQHGLSSAGEGDGERRSSAERVREAIHSRRRRLR